MRVGKAGTSGLLRYARNDVGKIVQSRGRRLKGLDEFETPEFVGRMARIERRRALAWYAMLSGAIFIGAAVGLVLF